MFCQKEEDERNKSPNARTDGSNGFVGTPRVLANGFTGTPGVFLTFEVLFAQRQQSRFNVAAQHHATSDRRHVTAGGRKRRNGGPSQ